MIASGPRASREIGGAGVGELFEADARLCSGLAVAACTANL
jgi:hypothetical protein